MRNVNLAHGSLYLLGAYVGYSVIQWTGSWYLGVAGGFLGMALVGLLLQVLVFRRMEGQDMRQTMVTIGISIVLADIMLWIWSGNTYQFEAPEILTGTMAMPFVKLYSTYRLVVLGVAIVIGFLLWLFLNRTSIGMMIRAGRRRPRHAVGDRRQRPAGLRHPSPSAPGWPGLAGVVGGTALSIAPGEDVRYLLASLIVTIVGGMGSITGAAIGALLIGMAEQFGLAYSTTYGVVYTFLIMVVVLAFRPQGIMGKRR